MMNPIESIGANAERSRSHNRQVVLDRIRAAGQIGRAEIARTSGLSTQAISNIMADLHRDGLIVELGRRSGARGLPAVQYGLRPDGGYAVGIEIRPDAVFAVVLDFCGAPLASVRKALPNRDLETVTAMVLSVFKEVTDAASAPRSRVLGVGIVMPGPFDLTGLGGSASELTIWGDASPADWFSDALDLPVIVENDANAAAVAELVTGAAKGVGAFAFIYFGSGLGMGIVQNGRLVRGGFGNAGEIGHIPVPCGGRVVPLESAVSRLSVQNHLARSGLDVASSEELARAFKAQNPAMLDWLARAAEPLSAAIQIVENLLDPETVVLGGALPDAIFDHLIADVALPDQSVSNRQGRDRPRLIRGSSGRMSATLGGAALVLNHVFTPQIAAA